MSDKQQNLREPGALDPSRRSALGKLAGLAGAAVAGPATAAWGGRSLGDTFADLFSVVLPGFDSVQLPSPASTLDISDSTVRVPTYEDRDLSGSAKSGGSAWESSVRSLAPMPINRNRRPSASRSRA